MTDSCSHNVCLDPLQCEMLVKKPCIYNTSAIDFVGERKPKAPSYLGISSCLKFVFEERSWYAALNRNSDEVVMIRIYDGR
jgi:hypothetical protein